MEEKIKNNKIPKKEKSVVKKRKKPSQQQVIKTISMVLLFVFVGGIFSSAVASIIYKNMATKNPSNLSIVDATKDMLKSATEYEAKVKSNPKDAQSLYNLVEIYSQLGYLDRSKKDEAGAKTYFLKAVDYATLLKTASPAMATSADYLRAGYYAEAGEFDKAEAIYNEVIASGKDPLISRIVYADFLKNKVADAAGATKQVQAAKNAAITDKEKTYVDNLIKQYNLN